MITIKPLHQKDYEHQSFNLSYQTNGYYDIEKTKNGFSITYQSFPQTVTMSFQDVFFNDWLEQPLAYGAFENNELIGYVEGSLESWNQRFRISNLCIFKEQYRHQGIGSLLMDTILKEAIKTKARMVVLETQSCNEKAISFYHKYGFDMIGFDLYAYTNTDRERHEIRIEMGKMVSDNK